MIALQEMDAPGVERIARGLGLSYVYYPAAVHPGGGKDFGNAVLVRGRILDDGKVFLPAPEPRTRRCSASRSGRDVDVDGLRFRMYSLHLSADAEMSRRKRLDQVRALIAPRPRASGTRWWWRATSTTAARWATRSSPRATSG